MKTNGTLRLFCALDLPGGTIEAIVRWQREQAPAGSGWRPVPRESLHLTLAFLGERSQPEADATAEVIAALPADPVWAELAPAPRPIPPRAPRMLALEVRGDGALNDLQAEVAGRLQALGVYEPEKRPFWPHVTALKRSKADSGGRRPARVGPLPEGVGGSGHAFGFVRVALYRSELRPEGSVYSRLAARELPQPGGLQKR